MGQGVAGLIDHELRTVVTEAGGGDAVFTSELGEPASVREANLDARERELEAREQRTRTLEQRIRAERSQLVTSRTNLKVGRNEQCPCGSGLK